MKSFLLNSELWGLSGIWPKTLEKSGLRKQKRVLKKRYWKIKHIISKSIVSNIKARSHWRRTEEYLLDLAFGRPVLTLEKNGSGIGRHLTPDGSDTQRGRAIAFFLWPNWSFPGEHAHLFFKSSILQCGKATATLIQEYAT